MEKYNQHDNQFYHEKLKNQWNEESYRSKNIQNFLDYKNESYYKERRKIIDDAYSSINEFYNLVFL